MQDYVFGIDAGAQLAVDVDSADLQFAEGDCLGRKHVTDLAGADSERDRAERAMRGSVGVSAGDRGSWLGDPLLGSNDMHNSLVAGGDIKISDSKLVAIFPQRLDHRVGQGIGKWFLALVGRHNVIHRGEGAMRIANLESELANHRKGLGTGHFVNEVRANQELRLTAGQLSHGVRIPDFLEQCFRHI